MAPLPKKLSKFATAVSDNTLYIGGGLKEAVETAVSSAILKYENDDWVRINARMPGKLLNCAMIPTTKGSMLILGGTTMDDSYNTTATEINLASGGSKVIVDDTGSDLKVMAGER